MRDIVGISKQLLNDEDYITLSHEQRHIWLTLCISDIGGRCGIFKGLRALAKLHECPAGGRSRSHGCVCLARLGKEGWRLLLGAVEDRLPEPQPQLVGRSPIRA